MEPQLQMLIYALGYTLLHSLWQGLLLYALLIITLRLMPAAMSRLRYNTALVILLGSIAWCADTFLSYWRQVQGVKIVVSQAVNGSVVSKTVHTTFSSGNAVFHRLDNLLPWLENYFPYVIALYTAGIIFLFCRLVINVMQVNNLRRRGIVQPSHEWMEMFYGLKARLGISRKIRLLFSKHVKVPMMAGAIKPVILMPFATVNHLTAEQFEAILLHELAHIRRNDYLVNILQTFLETILFFNPFTKLISAAIRREREHCCDDFVLANTSQPLSYAKALASLEFFRTENLSMAATGNKNQLFNRIKRMMEMKRNTRWFSSLPAVILTLLIGCSLVWLAPALAQSKKDKAAKESPAKKDGTKETKITVIDDNGRKKTYRDMDEMPPAERKKLEEKLDKVGVELEGLEEEINREVAKAMQEASEGIEEAQRELASVDIGAAINEAMSEVNWEKINDEINAAVAESQKEVAEAVKAGGAINADSLREVINAAIAKSHEAIEAVNWDSIHRNIEIAMDSARVAMRQAHKAMARAGRLQHVPAPPSPPSPAEVIPPAPPVPPIPANGGSYERMLSKMENDGLIDRSDYKIEKRHDKLYIDGVLQPEKVFRNYSRYLNGDKVTIKGKNDNISIKVKN